MADDVPVRVLIVTLRKWWIGVSRLPMALREAGFEVAAWCPEESFVARSGGTSRHYPFAAEANWQHELRRIVGDWQPRLIIPADETMAVFLRRIAGRWAGFGAEGRRVQRILLESLGDPRRTAVLAGKVDLQRLARSLGLRTPDDHVVPTADAAVATAKKIGYPAVLKDEYSAGGASVTICADEAALRLAWRRHEESAPPASLSRRIRNFLQNPFGPATSRRSLQRFIDGKPAFHAVVAWQGRCLGGLSAIVEVANPPITGPSCVVRLGEYPELSRAAAKLVESTGLTGFAGFDFVVEAETGHAYILECNPRPTPVSHLGVLGGASFGALLRAAATGAPMPASRPAPEKWLAFFPQELLRDAQSPYLGKAQLDFPGQDAPLVKAYLERFPTLAAAMVSAQGHLPPDARQFLP